MPQDLNAYQVFVSRELAKTSRQFKDIVHTRALWLSTNLQYGLHATLEWEIEMLLDEFICIEDDLLLGRIQEDSKLYEPTIQLKLTTKGMEYLSSWSADKIAMRNIQDRIKGLRETTERLKNSKGQPAIPVIKQNREGQGKYTIAEYGIMHVYMHTHGEKPVTENNAKDIAALYGFTKKTSGKQLLDEYRDYKNGAKNATNKTQLKRLQNILPELQLKCPQAVEDLKKDITALQKKIQ